MKKFVLLMGIASNLVDEKRKVLPRKTTTVLLLISRFRLLNRLSWKSISG